MEWVLPMGRPSPDPHLSPFSRTAMNQLLSPALPRKQTIFKMVRVALSLPLQYQQANPVSSQIAKSDPSPTITVTLVKMSSEWLFKRMPVSFIEGPYKK